MVDPNVVVIAAGGAVVVAELFAILLAYSYGVSQGKLWKMEEVDEKRDNRITWVEQRLGDVEEDLDDVREAVRSGHNAD